MFKIFTNIQLLDNANNCVLSTPTYNFTDIPFHKHTEFSSTYFTNIRSPDLSINRKKIKLPWYLIPNNDRFDECSNIFETLISNYRTILLFGAYTRSKRPSLRTSYQFSNTVAGRSLYLGTKYPYYTDHIQFVSPKIKSSSSDVLAKSPLSWSGRPI